MDILSDKQEQPQIVTLIQQAINETNLYKKIRITHTINHAFDTESKVHKDLHKYLDKILANTNFMRKLKLNCTIKENDQTAIEYYGKDYLGGDDNLQFDQEFEEILIEIENKVEEYLGFILKEISNKGDGISLEI